MQKMLFISLLAFALVFSVGPGEVSVIEPEEKIVKNGDSINAGFIGPGQTLSITVSSKVDTGGKYGQGGNWDNLKVEDMPDGWISTYSEYGPQLKINVRAPPDAREGTYRLELSVNDEMDREKIGEKVTFYVNVDVREDAVDLYVFPETQVVQVGSPGRYSVRVTNPSTASDMFILRGKGIAGWNFEKEVFVPGKSSTTAYYEIVNTDEETIPVKIEVISKSSDRIRDEANIVLITKSDPYYDIQSIRNGLLLYPPAEFLVYSVLYLIAALI
ncbi:MAG: hypothetical protein ACP5H8_03155 [Candidatus Micrarchaeia archaeon]